MRLRKPKRSMLANQIRLLFREDDSYNCFCTLRGLCICEEKEKSPSELEDQRIINGELQEAFLTEPIIRAG